MHILVQYLASYQSVSSAKTEFVHATTEAADGRSIPAEVVIAGLLIIARVTTMIPNTYEWLLCTLNNLVLIKIAGARSYYYSYLTDEDNCCTKRLNITQHVIQNYQETELGSECRQSNYRIYAINHYNSSRLKAIFHTHKKSDFKF